MKPTYLIIWSAALLLIGIAIGTFVIHDMLYPPMQVTDTTQADWHGVTVKPAIVIESTLRAALVAQGLFSKMAIGLIQLRIILVGGQHGSGTPITPDTIPPEINPQSDEVYKYLARGVYGSNLWNWFTKDYPLEPVNIIPKSDGTWDILTKDGQKITVPFAMVPKPKAQLKWSAEYLYGTNGTHTAIIGKDIFGWLAVKGGMEFGNGQVEGKVGGEISW